jgi:hypothetical protein
MPNNELKVWGFDKRNMILQGIYRNWSTGESYSVIYTTCHIYWLIGNRLFLNIKFKYEFTKNQTVCFLILWY